MKTFLITLRVNVPYPKEITCKVEAGEIHVAVYRAIKYDLRKALGKKRFSEVVIKAQRLPGIKSYAKTIESGEGSD